MTLYIVGEDGSLELTEKLFVTKIHDVPYARFKTPRHAMWTFRIVRGVCVEDRTIDTPARRILAREVPGEATYTIEEIEARLAKAREAVAVIERERCELLDALAPRCKVVRP